MIKYDENGLVPAIIQDAQGRVLMMAYMNEEAFNKTLQTGETGSTAAKGNRSGRRGPSQATPRRFAESPQTAIGIQCSLRWTSVATVPVMMTANHTAVSTT